MRVLRPLTSKATYRRWVYLVLGGAISVPYLLFSAVAVPSLLPFVTTVERATVIGGLLTLVVLAGTAFLPAVHVLESTAVRELLDDPVPDAPAKPRTRQGRRRAATMFVLHVVAGFVVSFFSLAAPVAVGVSVSAVFTGNLFQTTEGGEVTVPKGWPSAWLPVVFVFGVVLLIYAVWAIGGLLRRVAGRLLGMTAADRIARLERRTEQLAERNRLARELHDSVGHALTVVTVQAGAARRTLRTDPAFAERALDAIEESGPHRRSTTSTTCSGCCATEAARPDTAAGPRPSLDACSRRRALAGVEVTAGSSGDLAARAAGGVPRGVPDRAGVPDQRGAPRRSGPGDGAASTSRRDRLVAASRQPAGQPVAGRGRRRPRPAPG